jgi:lipoprotein-anchoring transpeptidase ErfK/SrfK
MTRKSIWRRPALGPLVKHSSASGATGPRAGRLQLLAIALCLSSCATPDTRHRIVVSIPEQRLALLDNGALVTTYPISTSKFAIGDAPGSRGTPLGELEIAKKIGDGAVSGTVFKDRRPTGEVLVPDAPGRDPIVSRILWLRGREPQNANAYGRYIYIHGTAEERNIGKRASYGCIRMRSRDVIQLYDVVGWGARVTILDQPLAAMVPALAPVPGPAGTTAVSSQ